MFLETKEIGNVYEEDRKKLDLDESAKRLIAARKRLNTVQATIIAVQVSARSHQKTS